MILSEAAQGGSKGGRGALNARERVSHAACDTLRRASRALGMPNAAAHGGSKAAAARQMRARESHLAKVTLAEAAQRR